MNVSVVIATCGDQSWSDLAWSRAYPSADAQDPRPEIVIEHYSAGYSVGWARNTAAKHASGDALIFLDADDELEPGYIAAMEPLLRPSGVLYFDPSVFDVEEIRRTLAKKYEGRQAPMVVTTPPDVEIIAPPALGVPSLRRVFTDCRETGPAIPNRGQWPRLNECVIGTLISRDLFERLGGFDADLTSLEDFDLFLRAYDAGARLVYVEGAVYRECVSTSGRNRDQSPYAEIWAEHERRIGA